MLQGWMLCRSAKKRSRVKVRKPKMAARKNHPATLYAMPEVYPEFERSTNSG